MLAVHVPAQPSEPRWRAQLAVALLAVVVSSPALFAEYTLDDFRAVLGHPAVTGEVPLSEVFVREYWGARLGSPQWSSSYRPLTTLGFAIEHRITAAPWLHHAVGIGVYAVLCVQLLGFVRRWLTPGAALATALVFAALPVHVENVASIVGRADVLAASLALAALAWVVPANDDAPLVRDTVLGALAYLAALCCKESVVLLPLTVGWLALLAARRSGALRDARALARHVLGPVVLGLVGVLYMLWRQRTLAIDLPEGFIAADNLLLLREGWLRPWGNLAVVGSYVELMVVPLRLCADHTYGESIPPRGLFDAGALSSWIGLVVMVLLVRDGVQALRGRSPGLGFAGLLALLLVGQWLVDLSVLFADRLALWPSVWLVPAAIHATERALPPARARMLLIAALVPLGIRFVQRSIDWHDSVSLQRSSLAVCPRAVHSRFILAHALRERSEVDEAIWHFAVAGAGRNAFPEPFESPLLDAEQTLPLAERLPRIPELVGATESLAYWAMLHDYLTSIGASAEAARVRELALVDRGPP